MNLIVNYNGKREKIEFKKQKNLLEIFQENNINISAPCGGNGTCGKCKVKLLSKKSNVTKKEKNLLSNKEIKKGVRLACVTKAKNNMEVELNKDQELEIMDYSIERNIDLDPLINKSNIKIEKPTLENQKDYLSRIYKKSDTIKTNYSLIKSFPENIDEFNEITLFTKNEKLIDIKYNKNTKNYYGISIDIGTTTVVLYLINLETGEKKDVYSFKNPQQKYGADVISRVNHTIEKENGIEDIQDVLIKKINYALKKLINKNNLKANNIYQCVIVGNTIMLHTLLGVSAESITKSPFTPIFTNSVELKASNFDININKNGIIKLLPSVSGYIGADILADMLTISQINDNNKWSLLIDIGTNGEIVLDNGENAYACSTAAGPALEGANISFGMAGIPGAISEYKITEDNQINYSTIRDRKAKGICGSGLIDIIAELYDKDYLDKNGGFKKDLDENKKDRITEYKNFTSYKVIDNNDSENSDIFLTQKDIREIQLAKGAIEAGIKVLIQEADISYEDIEVVYLAGGFGNYLKPESACTIGLIPYQLENKIERIGNGAGMGAILSLLNDNMFDLIQNLKNRINYIELSSKKDFQEKFMNSMYFGKIS